MGFSISLHSSERRSLIYWRMPGLFSSSYSPEGLLLICWCMSCAIAAARCAASLVPFTAPLHLRPMSVAADAGVLSPSAPARGILALLSASLFRIRPVMVIFPLRKQIIRRPCNFFCDCGLSFVRAKYKLTADQLICCAFAPRYALWRPAAIPNRKKVTI